MRQTIAEEETRVSYWRRIIQARLDLLRAGIGSHDPVTDLRTALTDAQGSHRRLAHVSVEAVEGLPPMDDLAELWSRIIDPDDEVAVRQLAAEMTDAEHRLSTYRSELFRRQDAVTAELIARYRENPILALTALPTEPE
ncbi:MAG: hypothetical protein EPO13_01585 [Actinomycetota bacterium]|nr:MAG: hypothetical protein EPO13_01585 [Actinomycetota bacterium]